jgi:anthranilate synthase/aminodeoxychorismate synthase-like glutamine amidotransferase
MILVIDNYDSFVYNLVQYIQQITHDVRVIRNDRINITEAARMHPKALVISPGPQTPREAGVCNSLIQYFSGKIPVLGVCLGHQCIGYSFGAEIVRAKRIVHGKTSEILHDNKTIFKGLPNPFPATRYHSLLIDPNTLSKELIVSARTDKNEIMGVRHKKYAVEGVQFHPESLLTKNGMQLLKNFFMYYKLR